MTKALFGHK